MKIIPQHFGHRMVAVAVISGLLPILIFGILLKVYGIQLNHQIENVVQVEQDQQWRQSEAILKGMAEDSIRQKALDVALQVGLYLEAHPQATVAVLQKDPSFRRIAVQAVGRAGYTALHESDRAIVRFHESPDFENRSLSSLSQTLPDFWSIIRAGGGRKSSGGYYDWQDPDGKIRAKFMYVVPVKRQTADGVRFSVAATAYLDEFLAPVLATEAVSRMTTTDLAAHVNELLNYFLQGGIILMGLAAVAVIVWSIVAGEYLSRFIREFRGALREVNDGKFSTRLQSSMTGDIRDLGDDFNRMVQRLEETTVSKDRLAESEANLQRSEQLLVSIIDFLPDPTFAVNRSGEVIIWNRALVGISGVGKEEMIGKGNFEHAVAFYGHRRPMLVDLMLRSDPQTEKGYALVSYERDGLIAEGEASFPRAEGRYLWGKAAPIFGVEGTIVGAIESVRDITERRRLDELYRTLAERSFAGVYVLQEGRIRFINTRAASSLGYDRQDVIGMKVTAFIHPEDRSRVLAQSDAMLKDQQMAPHEFRVLTRDGTVRWVLETLTPIHYLGQPAILGNVIDVTDRKEAERENERLSARLMQSQKLEAIGTLAGGIAHDFNNILSAIIGYTEMTLYNFREDTWRFKLEQVLQACERARRLVQQIVSFSRSGEQEKRPVDLAVIIEEVLKLLNSSIPASIDIRLNLASGSSYTVCGDPTQVHQVLMNLCINAYQAMEETGGILSISVDRVDIGSPLVTASPELPPGPYARLTVQDTGHGIDREVLGRIFDPFFTTKTTGEGTGLGLSVVYGIVKGSGGAIAVESEPHGGTAFHVYLPLISEVSEWMWRSAVEALQGSVSGTGRH